MPSILCSFPITKVDNESRKLVAECNRFFVQIIIFNVMVRLL